MAGIAGGPGGGQVPKRRPAVGGTGGGTGGDGAGGEELVCQFRGMVDIVLC